MKNRMITFGLAVVAAAAVLGGTAFAQPSPRSQADKKVSFGLQANWAEDADLGVGGRVIVDLGQFAEGLEAVGSFDYYFPSDSDLDDLGVDLQYFEVNANAVYKFDLQSSSLRPYVGAGLNVARAKGGIGIDLGEIGQIDISASETKVGLNLLGGVLFSERFFVEAKFEAGGGEQFVVTGGIRF